MQNMEIIEQLGKLQNGCTGEVGVYSVVASLKSIHVHLDPGIQLVCSLCKRLSL